MSAARCICLLETQFTRRNRCLALKCYSSVFEVDECVTYPSAADWSKELASTEKLVAQLISNREKILRHAWIPQLFAGLVFLGLGYFIGHAHFHLIREGVRAPGRIVGYKQESFKRSSSSTSSTTTSYMPIVEFHTNERFIQFQDWLGARIEGSKNVPVMVLYDPANPSVAMIDRPAWNWLPWAPILALGLFLVLVAMKGFFQSRRSAEM